MVFNIFTKQPHESADNSQRQANEPALLAHRDDAKRRIARYQILCRVRREPERAFVVNADQLGMEVIGMLWEVGVGRFC
jgi:hypothetical protein